MYICTCLTEAMARLPIARWHAAKNTRASIDKLKIATAKCSPKAAVAYLSEKF